MSVPLGYVRLVCPQPWPSGERVSHGAFSAEPQRDPDDPHRHLVDVPRYLLRHFLGGPAGFVVLDGTDVQ